MRNLFLALIPAFFSYSAFSQGIADVSIEPNNPAINQPIKIIIKNNGDKSACGLEINLGDGNTKVVRAESFPFVIEHTYTKEGKFAIAVNGKLITRGLRSTFPCQGDLKSIAVIVGNQTAGTAPPVPKDALEALVEALSDKAVAQQLQAPQAQPKPQPQPKPTQAQPQQAQLPSSGVGDAAAQQNARSCASGLDRKKMAPEDVSGWRFYGQNCNQAAVFYGKAGNELKAFEFVSKACELANVMGCHSMGLYLATGFGGVKEDKGKAMGLLLNACLQDSELCDGAKELAEGSPETVRSAIMQLETQCAKSKMDDCSNLGVLYYRGDFVKQDNAKAVGFLSKACDSGASGAACRNLNAMTKSGVETPEAKKKAAYTAYQRQKLSVAEEALNYASTGDVKGNEYTYWRVEKCIATEKDGKKVNLGEINQTAFRITRRMVRNIVNINGPLVPEWVSSDGNITFSYTFINLSGGGTEPVMERLQKAWGLVFKQCAGKKSAF